MMIQYIYLKDEKTEGLNIFQIEILGNYIYEFFVLFLFSLLIYIYSIKKNK